MGNKKVVVITGSAGGIGSALVRKYKQGGWKVVGVDIDDTEEVDVRITCDFSAPGIAGRFIEQELKNSKIDKVDCLINNAATQIISNFDDIEGGDFRKTMDINVLAPFFITQSIRKYMDGGCVINISSIHANQSKKDFLMYATSKGAMKTMTQNMALELAPKINVIGILPAAIETEMLRVGLTDSQYEELKTYHPSDSIGDPKKLSDFIYHISENNEFFTGTNIEWDGGISKVLNDPTEDGE